MTYLCLCEHCKRPADPSRPLAYDPAARASLCPHCRVIVPPSFIAARQREIATRQRRPPRPVQQPSRPMTCPPICPHPATARLLEHHYARRVSNERCWTCGRGGAEVPWTGEHPDSSTAARASAAFHQEQPCTPSPASR
jgi:hypothetical protein